MKRVEAIVQACSWEDVHAALERRGVSGVTVTEVVVTEPTAGTLRYRGAQYTVDASPRWRIDVVVSDVQAIPVAEAIVHAARRGRSEDGVVAIVPVDDAVRIRTAERGAAAVDEPTVQYPWSRSPGDPVPTHASPPGRGRADETRPTILVPVDGMRRPDDGPGGGGAAARHRAR